MLVRALQARHGLFSGFGIQYSVSAIVNPQYQESAEGLIIGRRMLPYIFIRAADVRPLQIHNLLPADGRFKVLFFVGNLTLTRILELQSLAEELSKPLSFLQKYGADSKVSSIFDIITIIAAEKHDTNYLHIPAFFRPHWTKSVFFIPCSAVRSVGLTFIMASFTLHRRVLLDDTDLRNVQGGHGYERFRIDTGQITVVVVRPDGYVGMIAPSSAVGELDTYFGSFMVPRGGQESQSW